MWERIKNLLFFKFTLYKLKVTDNHNGNLTQGRQLSGNY